MIVGERSVWTTVATLAVGLVLALGAGCQKQKKPDPKPTQSAEKAPDAPAPVGNYYVVKKGDTLWAIASRHHIPVEELIEVNGIESGGLIAPGQLIFIPADDPLALAPDNVADKADAPEPIDTSKVAPVTTSADLMWPISGGVILRDFERKRTPYDGLLVAAPAGTPVSAADDGKVLYVGDEGSAFGTVIIVEHSASLVTVYAHLDGVDVEPGQPLKRGAVIGRVGSSGRAESPQLHFQVRENREPVDPLTHLPPP